MELSSEDVLRLKVLLANQLQAVRIDESSMSVHGLSGDREAVVKLNPAGRDEDYLRLVRELLSLHVLGSPGGYPVYIQRWTRMGQARDQSLERLLLLGEPEAVVAVVHASGLTNELARRAWWTMPISVNARRMLERDCVARGTMGPILAEALVEYLPFEEEPEAIIETVRLVLQPGLISGDRRRQLWAKGAHRNVYYVGFLQTVPDALPGAYAPSPVFEALHRPLADLSEDGNPFAAQLHRCLDAPGQGFLQTAEAVLRRPVDQDVVVVVFEAIAAYFSAVAPTGPAMTDMQEAVGEAEAVCAPSRSTAPAALGAILERVPAARAQVVALRALSRVGEPMLRPIFARTTATGSLMRRKLEPLTGPMFQQFARLRGRV
ncbi:MAG: hypothetical protein B7Z66_10840 [Chromatiales bacterium 21-64-14]|nr:MAG: hypothetical protein B7Z66_10840 [Chromatiales bacterium 21-64-14]HQU15616.1 sulfur reduction protein DsrS [Gammaproteobacteria bacterium]